MKSFGLILTFIAAAIIAQGCCGQRTCRCQPCRPCSASATRALNMDLAPPRNYSLAEKPMRQPVPSPESKAGDLRLEKSILIPSGSK